MATRKKGWFGEFEVWYNKHGMANLLSVPMLEEDGYAISTHTQGDWVVTSPKGTKIIFKWDTGVTRGIPYIDLQEHQEGISMIETVRKNFEGVTKKQLNKAITARLLQRQIGHPPDKRYKEIMSLLHQNCPVSVTDINNARLIFGPNVSGLRGRTTRDGAVVRVKEQRVAIPRDFYKMHKMVTLTADVMFISGIPFLVTSSK